LIWRADAREDVLAALREGFGDVAALAVLPRPGAAPIRVLLRAVNGAAARLAEHGALALNDVSGRPSAAAEAILRGGGVLPLAAIA
jgi:tRNA1(Val) A37 N6-methylase TrmN6